MQIASAILSSSGDLRAESLIAQLRSRRAVERTVAASGLSVVVPATAEDLLVDLPADTESRPVVVRDVSSGRELRFRVLLGRGGFFLALVGSTDGRWPKSWSVVSSEVADAARGALVLPSSGVADAARLAVWLGVDHTRLDGALVLLRLGPRRCNAWRRGREEASLSS